MKGKILNIWNNLTLRERLLVIVLGLILIPTLVFNFILLPMIASANRAQDDYLNTKRNLINLDRDLNLYNDFKKKNVASSFNFQDLLTKIMSDIDILELPTINQEKSEVFGNTYVLRFNNLRSDQIFRLVYSLENNFPPVIIEKFETAASVQTKNLSNLTLVVKTE